MHLGRNTTYQWFLGQSVNVLSRFNAVWDGVFKIKPLSWRNNILFKQNTENVVYIITCKSRLDTNYCQVQGWKNLMHVFLMHQISFSREQNIIQENDSYAHLKKEKIISGTHSGSWFLKKKIQWCTFLHCGAPRHQKCQ